MKNNQYKQLESQLEKIAKEKKDFEDKNKLNFITNEIMKNKEKIKKYIDKKDFSIENIYEQFSYFYEDLLESKSTLFRLSEIPKKLDSEKIHNFLKDKFVPYELGYYSFPKELKEKIESKAKSGYNDFLEFINLPVSDKGIEIAKKYNIL